MKDIGLADFKETILAKEYENLQFTVILIQPEHSGNIGSIARVMANFNFQNLVIFNPIEKLEKIFSYETQGFAMHGKQILLNAKVIQPKNEQLHLEELKKLFDQFDLIIATTAKGKRYNNIRRNAIFPEHLELPISKKLLKIAIIFGKESRGLTNEEISLTDIILRIPTYNLYPTINISHACAIILYEIFKKTHNIRIGRGRHPVLLAEREERKILIETIDSIIQNIKIRNYRQKRVYFAFRNVLERSLMTRKEMSLILGLFSKINSVIINQDLYNENL
jgi:TrmH family RNA methyltransferase